MLIVLVQYVRRSYQLLVAIDVELVIYHRQRVVRVFIAMKTKIWWLGARFELLAFLGQTFCDSCWFLWINSGDSSLYELAICQVTGVGLVTTLLTRMWSGRFGCTSAASSAASASCRLACTCRSTIVSKLEAVVVTMLARAVLGALIICWASRAWCDMAKPGS